MDGKNLFVSTSHAVIVGLSLFGLTNSYAAITRLQGYESATKKLAKWSNTVEQELYKTRTTQASGAIATLVSLVASLTLLFAHRRLNPWIAYSIAPGMLVGILFARGHIKNYWTPHRVQTVEDGKTKEKDVQVKVPALPNLGEYREAQKKTEDLLLALEWLEYGWLGISFVGGLVGYGK